MQWEHLTAPKFQVAVRQTGVCVLTLGVLERHSDHLPLGTDFLNGHKIACLAAEKEPSVVFPPFYFGQIYEARCFPGTVTIPPLLLMQLLQSVLDEIDRNGFSKIVLYNAHGGNNYWLPFVTQCNLAEAKNYTIYYYRGLEPAESEAFQRLLETPEHGHACECETSITLANFEHLVDRAAIPAQPATAGKRLQGLTGGFTAIGWYANYPEHYAGDARPASVEKGVQLRQIEVDSLARFIARVKADQIAPVLQQEFNAREKQLREK